MSDEGARELVWATTAWSDAASELPALDPALMTLLLENISTRVAVLGVDRRYLYVNQETLRFMGRPASEVIGRHMSEVLAPGIVATIAPYFDRAFAGEQLRRRAWADYGRQGLRFREQWYVPYRPGGGAVTAVVVCGLDHTDQRLGEQELEKKRAELRTSEALKSAIFDHSLVAFVATDAEGCIVEFNPAAETMFGRKRASVLGEPVSTVMIPARYREGHEEGMRRMRAGNASRVLGKRLEMHAMRADGSEFPMEMMLWRTDAEGATFYTASISDLSERQGAAKQIERHREALRQSEKLTAMGSLLASVSHELNNPLAIVMGRASLLEEKIENQAAGSAQGDHAAELIHDARRIREAAERCGRIVRTFLDMARSRPPQRGQVGLDEVVRSSFDMLGTTYRSHDIELRLELAPGLPPVSADADQLCQIVLNLLVNAQQALALAPPPRRVVVQTGLSALPGAAAAEVWLRVCDSGAGVDAEARARLFEPFFTTKAEGFGTGLGLSVSRALAREHGGELVLEPAGDARSALAAAEMPGGAAFRLTLPVAAAAASAEAAADAVSLDDDGQAVVARILVVDDEAELADMIREMLESAGYEVATAESGAVALELLGAARFDAVVSDLRMPDMDGIGLWRAVCADHPALIDRLLFVTGDTLSPAARELFGISGCVGLDKPFTRSELLARVAALLGPPDSSERTR